MDRIVPVFHSLSKNLRKIHKKSSVEISVVQSSIMYEIGALSKPSMQAVAEAVGMDITTFSRQIGTLEKKRLVVKTPYEGDRRIYILSLTKEGEQVVESINALISAEMENVLASMNDFERETVVRSMHALDKKLSED